MHHRRSTSSDSPSRKSSLTAAGASSEAIHNIRSKPSHIFDTITRKLLKLGITLAITTFVGLIIRYLVQEFDPNVGQIVSVSTSRVGNRDFASFSVSRNFLQRILEFIEESLSIIATVLPLGFPLCTLINKYFARIRAGQSRCRIEDERVLCMIPKYIVIGDSLACQTPNGSSRLRPLVRDSIYHLIRAHLKPKLISEDSHDEARKLAIRIGLLRRDHHRLACIKSVDLLKNITDSRGDIKQAKVRYLLSRLKVLTQSTPADKSFLIYLIKHCETQPNDRLVYLGYSFTDPEAMRLADCAITFADCDDDDVQRNAQVQLKSPNQTFTDLYLFVIVSLLYSNIVQSYALYQISAAVSSCLYRFLTITVFQEQLISHSQFMLLTLINQLIAIFALMTKWLSSLPKSPLKQNSVAEMSHAVTEDSLLRGNSQHNQHSQHRRDKSRSTNSLATPSLLANGKGRDWREPDDDDDEDDEDLDEYTSQDLDDDGDEDEDEDEEDEEEFNDNYDESENLGAQQKNINLDNNHDNFPLHELSAGNLIDTVQQQQQSTSHSKSPARRTRTRTKETGKQQTSGHRSASVSRSRSRSRNGLSSSNNQLHVSTNKRKARRTPLRKTRTPIHLSGVDLDDAVIDSRLVTSYRQTFHNSQLIDDVTYRLVKLHIAYQALVLVIIMIFGHSMFQLNSSNSRQHQTLALNSLIMNNIFNLANCFNQFGAFNLSSGLKNHPFFLCLLILAIFVQVCLTELNAFGLENLNPIQWFVCFVFASLSALIAPLTGQQQQQQQQQLQLKNNRNTATSAMSSMDAETRIANTADVYKREKHNKKQANNYRY